MPKRLFTILIQLTLGAIGGFVAWAVGIPMPFLIGSLGVTAAIAIWTTGSGRPPLSFPQPVRQVFMAIIGVMIGQSFTPDLIGAVGSLWVSLAAVAVFVVIAQSIGYVVFRRIGGYDRPTAMFAAMPGGLIEAIAIGEKAGGDVSILMVQHFARVILVVIFVPLLFLLWTGETVGSSAGVALSQTAYDWLDIVQTVAVALAGIAIGKRLRFPAPVLIGPLALSALLQATGTLETVSPVWLLNLSQLVVGVGLGAAFAGIKRSQLVKSFALGALTVGIYLVLGLLFAAVLSGATPIPQKALFISFAPGGVTEMSLIALSLNIGPIIVATHHVFRITFTVIVMSVVARVLEKSED